MDKRFRDKRLWIGLGGLAIVFLCIAMCGMASLAMFTLRQGPTYAPVPYSQPPAADDGTLPPPPNLGYGGYGPLGIGRHSGFSPFGFIAKLFVAGMVALLALGLLKRVLWGGRHCARHHWHGHHYRYPHRAGRLRAMSGRAAHMGGRGVATAGQEKRTPIRLMSLHRQTQRTHRIPGRRNRLANVHAAGR